VVKLIHLAGGDGTTFLPGKVTDEGAEKCCFVEAGDKP